MKTLNTFLMLALCLLFQMAAHAQCNTPTGVTQTVVNSTCLSNGSITINSVLGSNGDSYEYSLFNASNTTEIKPWQASTTLNNLPTGTYLLKVRALCAAVYSSVYSTNVSVGGSYAQPTITNVVVNRRAKCNDGMITINAANGTNPKTYALVSSVNEAEPIAAYVRNPRSGATFDSLAAGTYYARVYDACGSYVTRQVVVAAFTATSGIAGMDFYYQPCNTLEARLFFSNFPDFVPGSRDTLSKVWITYPDGSADSLGNAIAGSFTRVFSFDISRLGTVGTGAFPGNIGGAWPKTFTAGAKDVCGNIYSYTGQFAKPTLSPTFTGYAFSSQNSCDTIAYRFFQNVTNGSGGTINMYGADVYGAFYSLDGGSWLPVTGRFQEILIQRGTSYNACYTQCGGDTICLSVTAENLAPFSVALRENTRFSCDGMSGLQINQINGTNPIQVALISGPTGQTLAPFAFSGSSGVYYETPEINNLLPGSYTFEFTDDCGRTTQTSINLTHPHEPIDYTYVYNCSGDMVITLNPSERFWNGQAGAYGRNPMVAELKTMANATIPGGFYAAPPNYDVITIPAATLNTYLTNGVTYKIQVHSNFSPYCTVTEKTFTKTSNGLSLANSLSVPTSCASPNDGSIIAIATGGTGYTYSLFNGPSNNPANRIAGPQASNIFNNLNNSLTYIVTVSDNCGRGTEASVSFGAVPFRVSYSTATMPCPGNSMTLSVANTPGVQYQWYKNDVLMPGKTQSDLLLSNLQQTDSGTYKAVVTIASCLVSVSSYVINPAVCGTPLPISLYSFSVRAIGETAELKWATASERQNNGFEVLRSSDGKSWESIGFVKSQLAAGNSNTMLSYNHLDGAPLSGKNYYRLRQINHDGKATYTDVKMIYFNEQSAALTLFPNPATSRVQVDGKDISDIQIFNSIGSHVHLNLMKTAQGCAFDVSALPPGIYTIIIRSGQQTTTQKLTVTPN